MNFSLLNPTIILMRSTINKLKCCIHPWISQHLAEEEFTERFDLVLAGLQRLGDDFTDTQQDGISTVVVCAGHIDWRTICRYLLCLGVWKKRCHAVITIL